MPGKIGFATAEYERADVEAVLIDEAEGGEASGFELNGLLVSNVIVDGRLLSLGEAVALAESTRPALAGRAVPTATSGRSSDDGERQLVLVI